MLPLNRPGSAYVFVRSGASWAQQAKFTPSDGIVNDSFGCAVAIDGDTALIADTKPQRKDRSGIRV